MRPTLRFAMLALWALSLPVALSARAQPGSPLAILGPELASRLDADAPLPAEGLRIIVKLRRDAQEPQRPMRRVAVAERQDRVLRRLKPGRFQLGRRHRLGWGFSGRAQRSAIEALVAAPDVEIVYLDGRIEAHTTQGRALIGADVASAAGFDGAGVTLAVLDTGFDTDHEALSDDLVAEYCFCDDHPAFGRGCCPGGGEEEASAEDDDGHGTSVSGIITSNGAAGPAGAAREAGIVAVKVLDSKGGGFFSDIDAGLDWVLDNAATHGISVLNLSFGSGVEYTNPNAFPCTGSVTADLIRDLVAAGITVVVSAGNEAFTAGLGHPACVPAAISVGGVYDAALGNVGWCGDPGCTYDLCEDEDTQPDGFVCHSNRGPMLDVLAPDWMTRTPLLGGGAVNFGGTSAAAPYIAAQAALLVQADPTLTPAQIRTLLVSHGPQIPHPDDPLVTFPRADVAAALAEVIGGPDTDADGVPEDGNGSGTVGDAPCADGVTVLCDDSCPLLANPAQRDADGDGLGDVCDLPCDNGVDDDADGFTDLADAGCLSATWVAEDPQCSDDIDNDGDGAIDFDGTPPDAQCGGAAYVNREEQASRCGLGAELVLLAPILARLRRRRRRI